MSTRIAHIDGIALWAPTLPGWTAARAVFRGEAAPADPPNAIPAPSQLPPAERRRAPQTVALALAAADEAVRSSGHDAASLLAVFASAHGDLPVIDELCRTLVHTPTLVSPTRFLHSIHNAPAGVWSLLTRNTGAQTALSGATHSFAHGLFEALVQSAALFHHSDIRLPPPLERALARVLVTPSLHWVHHHAIRADTDSNYGTVLSVWDRLFGSRSATLRTPAMPIGVERLRDLPLPRLLLAPFGRQPRANAAPESARQ